MIKCKFRGNILLMGVGEIMHGKLFNSSLSVCNWALVTIIKQLAWSGHWFCITNDCTAAFISLWLIDAILRCRYGSASVQVISCCLTAPSYYLNQRCLTISKVRWHLSTSQDVSLLSIPETTLKITYMKCCTNLPCANRYIGQRYTKMRPLPFVTVQRYISSPSTRSPIRVAVTTVVTGLIVAVPMSSPFVKNPSNWSGPTQQAGTRENTGLACGRCGWCLQIKSPQWHLVVNKESKLSKRRSHFIGFDGSLQCKSGRRQSWFSAQLEHLLGDSFYFPMEYFYYVTNYIIKCYN